VQQIEAGKSRAYNDHIQLCLIQCRHFPLQIVCLPKTSYTLTLVTFPAAVE
jgi:hypothetical protein